MPLTSSQKAACKRYRASKRGRIKSLGYERSADRIAYRKNWWKTSPKAREIERRYAEKRRKWMQAEKLRRGCKRCGYNKHPAALDFDHVRGGKHFAISKVKRSIAALKAEIAKCDVLCSNCHRIKTYEDRQRATDKRTIR